MRVAIIGGGVIGLCCARALRKRGADVVLLERDTCGAGASRGNGGWVTPGLSAPIPAPGVMRQAAKWMLDRESPLLVRPRVDPTFLKWSYAFWRACSERTHRAGTAATLALAADCERRFDDLLAAGLDFEHYTEGLLFLVRDAAHLAEWQRAYEQLALLGFDGDVQLLDRAQLRATEPSVDAGVLGGLIGGRERHVRPESLTRALRDELGDIVQEGVTVTRLRGRDGGFRIEAADGFEVADRVVVAAGAWTSTLLQPLGVTLPLEAAKGYSVTAARGEGAPRRALYLTEAKVGVSPFRDAVRVAGTLELAGLDLRIDERRLAAVERAARTYLSGWRPGPERIRWAGLRPLAPDGVPIVGEVPGHEGLFVATGHGMLGITLAPSTGEALAPEVLGEGPAPVLAPLSPARFARHVTRPRRGTRRPTPTREHIAA